MNNSDERLIADLRATVDDALEQIDALLAGTGDANSIDRTASTLTTVGGPDLDLAPRTSFLDERWLRDYRPARERGIYVASSSGLRRFERRLGLGLAKVGTCDAASLGPRMEQIRRDRTGACFHDGTRYFTSGDGWTDWFARQLRPVVGPSPGSPVRIEDRLLTFPLPATLHWQDFDDRCDARIRIAALDRWAMSDEGLTLCAARDVPPRHLQRSTPYGGGADVRLSPTTEICLFDPVIGPGRLIRIVEDVLLAHVLGTEA